MGTITVLGAGGLTGRRLVRALGERGHLVTGAADLAAAADADLAVVAVRDPDRRAELLGEAARRGLHAVDAGTDAVVAEVAYDGLDGLARQAGVVVVPAAGSAVGDLLAATALAAVRGPVEVHVTWAFPDRGGWRKAVAPGLRGRAAGVLARPMPVLLDGRHTEELAGEARRLAWFPRPIGPAHAAAVPGPDPLAVQRYAPGLRVARTYLAVSAWRAELLQGTANAVRAPWLRAVVQRRWERGDEPVEGAAAPRWACVVESRGTAGEVARAWAYGRDVVGLGVDAVVALSEAILAGHADAGATPPARIEVPATLLDQLSARGRLRWSVARPATTESDAAASTEPERPDGR
ncbi:hypothetical protein [Egicoccus sp. AB-alg2]|uniref:hypothetical protein n=1 Tax=Egicoccus sp. AB-alg2 TaxID=3242693 RepID=UPI00359DB257